MQVKCRFCGKMYFKKAGFRKTNQGKTRIYKCLVCGKRFTPDSPFLKMRFDPRVILQCIDLYSSGLSLRQITQHIWRTNEITLSHMSVHRWTRKYSRMLKPYLDSIKIDGKDSQLVADEMMVKIKNEWTWLWNVMEKDTRYVLASTISRTREMGVAKDLFKEAKSKIEGLPMQITTDGMKAYPRAINSAFYRSSYPRVEHFVAPGISHKHHNNLIERHHNTIRARTKVMRGFGNMESAIDIMNLWHIFFNFLRPNMALGNSTPSQSAGIEFKNLMDMIWRAHEWHKQHSQSN